MADEFKGDIFIASDEDLCDDYEVDDTHLHNLLRNQSAWLAARGSRVGFGWLNPNRDEDAFLGDRAWASTRWLCVYFGDVWVSPGQTFIDLPLEVRVGTSDPAAASPLGEVDLHVEVVGYADLYTTISSDRDYHHVELEVPFHTQPSSKVVTLLRVWIKSFLRAPHDITPTRFLRATPGGLFPPDAVFFPGFPASAPDEDSIGESAFRAGGEYYETLVHVDDGVLNPSAIVWPVPPDMSVDEAAESLDADLVHLAYIQIRGFNYEERFDPRPAPQSTLQGGIPERSRAMGQQVINAARAPRRPKMHLLGGVGDYDQASEGSSTEDHLYYERWRHIAVDGEHTLTVPEGDVLLWDSIHLTEPDPFLDVMGWLCPWYVPSVSDPVIITSLEDLLAEAFELDWTIRAEFSLKGTGVVGVTEQTLTLKHIPATPSGVWPLLQQLHFRHAADNRRGYTCKEGALYDVDFGLLTPFRMVVDGSLITEAVRDYPLSCSITASHAPFTNPNPGNSIRGKAAEDNTYLTRMALTVASRRKGV